MGKCLKMSNYRVFDILLDILHKVLEILGQEHVKRGLLSFQDKIGTIAPDFPGKNDSFNPVLTLLFCLSLPKIWLFRLHNIYIFEMSGNRAIRWNGFIMLSLIL